MNKSNLFSHELVNILNKFKWLDDLDLDDQDKAIYKQLSNAKDEFGVSDVSVSVVASRINISAVTARKKINKMCDIGILIKYKVCGLKFVHYKFPVE